MIDKLTINNIKRLRKALKEEPSSVVLKNAFNAFFSISKTSNKANKNVDFELVVDSAVHSKYSDSLVVSGWMNRRDKNHNIVLKVNDDIVKHFYYREDVHNALGLSDGGEDAYYGYIYITSFDSGNLVKQCKITVEQDGVEVLNVDQQITEVASIEHMGSNRNQQYYYYFPIKDYINELNFERITDGPLISIVVPVYNVSIEYLKECVDSVVNQSYTNWQLCICDDKSSRIDTLSYLNSLEGTDPRIKIHFSEINQNISGSSNAAIDLADGEFIALLDHDDVLHKDALHSVVVALQENPDADILYSDEDKLSVHGYRQEPYFKPQYSRELLLANNYICHFLTIRKTLGDKIGWFRKGFEGAQDHDLILRLVEQTNRIVHIPQILYHWRKIPGSTALAHGEKSYANEAGRYAVKQALDRRGVDAEVEFGDWAGSYRVKYNLKDEPKVTIIIPFKDKVGLLKQCLKSIFEKTVYSNIEILLVDNNSEENATQKYLSQFDRNKYIRVLNYTEPFNYSKINNWAVKQATGEFILLLNNDISVITKGWLTTMIGSLLQDGVGAVGAKLLYDDNTSQHSGIVMGIGGVAGHAFKGMPDAGPNHYYLDGIPRNVSGCTAACLMIKKEVFDQVKGLNAEDLKVAFNDVDLCLKICTSGWEIIYLSDVKLHHYESKSRGYEDTPQKIARFKREESYMKDTWKDYLENDPYYNPNLSLIRQDFALNMEGLIVDYLKVKKV